jgi:uncharacterized membrane protein YbhN (UPF0104 family)
MKPPSRSEVRRLFTALLVAAAFLFLGREIVRNLDQLRSFRWEVRPSLLLLSVALLSLVFLWGVMVWRVLLRSFGAEVPFRPLARAWFLANLSRYIPGMVWQFVSLAQLGPSIGLSPSATVASLLVQMGFLVLSAALLGVYLLPVEFAGELGVVLLVLRVIAPLAVLLVHPAVVRGGLRMMERVTRTGMLEWQGSWFEGVRILLLSVVAWLLYGAAFHLFLDAFIPLSSTAITTVTAINALAFLVGYAAFFAPGGLGFKEGALALLLSGIVPGAVAASLAIIARLWTIAAEVLPVPFLLRRGAPCANSEPPSVP